MTISIGIAALSDPADGAASILKRADQALYRAKRDGRNRVVPDAARIRSYAQIRRPKKAANFAPEKFTSYSSGLLTHLVGEGG